MSWVAIVRAILAITETLVNLARDTHLRKEGRRAAFLEIYRENYERLRKADEIRSKDKPSSDSDIINRL